MRSAAHRRGGRLTGRGSRTSGRSSCEPAREQRPAVERDEQGGRRGGVRLAFGVFCAREKEGLRSHLRVRRRCRDGGHPEKVPRSRQAGGGVDDVEELLAPTRPVATVAAGGRDRTVAEFERER